MVSACALANSSVITATGGGRGNFAQVHAAHAIRNREKVAVRAGLVARGGNKRPHRVFIVGANLAEIACLAELYIQHGRFRLESLPDRSRDDGLLRIVKHPLQNGHWVASGPHRGEAIKERFHPAAGPRIR